MRTARYRLPIGPAIWVPANTKNGTSSHELGRAIEVTQKTAWYMFHRIRLAMKEMSTPALLGKVEVNETFVGGKTRATKVNVLGMRKLARGPATGKVTVLGMIP